jgi:hypothetical protein
MLDQLIVVDYQEGAGGEFMASWLSAHFGQKLEHDLQSHPNYLQKWLNSHSLIYDDWQQNFVGYLKMFNQLCAHASVQKIAVPYHLWKYPEHVHILQEMNQARFVRINCDGYQADVFLDFRRKVLDRKLTHGDFDEIKFLLQNQPTHKKQHCMNLLRDNRLIYKDLLGTDIKPGLKILPSHDIEILYKDFFVDFTSITDRYHVLCHELGLQPNASLLDSLVERNKKNLQIQQES